MEDFSPFGSPRYLLLLTVLLFARGMDFLSTWVATPNLMLEGNPLAKKLGWKVGIGVNVVFCFVCAFWIAPAVIISTSSALIAARNFQSAWLMRSLGEIVYQEWHSDRIRETRMPLYLFCLFGQTLLTAGVGAAVVCLSRNNLWIVAIGLGIVTYAIAITFYTLLSVWRSRHHAR